MTNPLIEKYNELYNPKPPEPPKPVEKSKPPIIKSYDPDDLKECFIETAFKVKTGLAQVSSMSMERDWMSGTKITFEIMLYEP